MYAIASLIAFLLSMGEITVSPEDSDRLGMTVQYPPEVLANCIEGSAKVSYSIYDGIAVVDNIESNPPGVFDEAARSIMSDRKFPAGKAASDQTAVLKFSLDVEECRKKRTAGTDLDCKDLGRAHAALLNGCFSARREFMATLNNKPVRRQLIQLDYGAGQLNINMIEEEVFEKRIEMNGEGDMVADSLFSCDLMTRNTDGRYVLESADEPERILFDYDHENGVLLPLRWEFEEKTRFLFKKFHIQAHADYSEVRYTACNNEPDDGHGP